MARELPIALSPGEPAGVGPEITAQAWQALRAEKGPAFFLIGDIAHQRAMAPTAAVAEIRSPDEAAAAFPGALPVLSLPLQSAVTPGKPNPAHAGEITGAIRKAVELCLAGKASALVTNPIQKETLYQAGFRFEGHTDYLAALAREMGHAASPVMMLCAPDLRTVPVTIHIPLKDVPGALSVALILEQARVTARDLTARLGIARPRIGITGLNPHAGENGMIGREEIDIIAPAIATLRAEGLDVSGPLSADATFHAEARAAFDVILCMYHDQALIPVKTLGFHEGINATLGLPFIRTSPDHGTALALAGTGKANPSSLIHAIRMAADMARRSGL